MYSIELHVAMFCCLTRFACVSKLRCLRFPDLEIRNFASLRLCCVCELRVCFVQNCVVCEFRVFFSNVLFPQQPLTSHAREREPQGQNRWCKGLRYEGLGWIPAAATVGRRVAPNYRTWAAQRQLPLLASASNISATRRWSSDPCKIQDFMDPNDPMHPPTPD